MIIVSSARKETEVGIMIALQLSFTEGTVMGNRLNLIKEERLERGNTLEERNGNRVSFSIAVVQVVLVHLAVVRIHEGQHIAGRRVPDQSHKLSFPISIIGPATKKDLKIFCDFTIYYYLCKTIKLLTMARTSRRVAKKASSALRSKRTTKAYKSVAGSALRQRRKK